MSKRRSDDSLLDLPTTEDEIFDDQVRAELNMLLTEAHSLLGIEQRLKQVKARIVELVQGMPGVRYRNQCAIVRYQSGRRTLDRALLIENGVEPTQIEASMKEGNGYWTCELPQIGD